MKQSPPTFALANLAQLTPRRIALLAGLALLTLALMLTLGGGEAALRALAGADLRWLGLALLIHYSGFAVRGLRWQQLLRVMGYRLGWRYSTALLLSGWFASALLPARAGDLLRVGVLRLEDDQHPVVPVADGLGSILLERLLDLLAIILLGAGIGFLLLRTQMPIWVLTAYGVGLAALAGLTIALLLAPPLLRWLRGWSTQIWWQKLLDFAGELAQSLRVLGGHPVAALLVIGESLYIWLCDALLMWLVLRSMGVTVGLGSIAFVALTVDIFAAIPLTPGGIGQIEAVNAALLALLPLPPFNVAAAVLLNRAISYWSFLLFSGIVTFAAGIGQLLVRKAEIRKAEISKSVDK